MAVVQRLAVAASCGVFYALTLRVPIPGGKTAMFSLITILACVEKLCSIMNMVSVEKDWVSYYFAGLTEHKLTSL